MAYDPIGGGQVGTLSAGGSSNTLGQVIFSNAGNVSFGLSNGTMTASASPGGGGLTNIKVSAGTASNNLSAFEFNNGGGVSFGLNGSTITATVQTNYLTTAMASNRGSDFVQATAAFAGTNASGTIGSNGISVAVGNYITTAMASNRGSDFMGTNTALTANGVSMTANSSGLSLNFPAFLTTAQPPGAYLTTARASNDAIGLNSALTANGVSVTANSSGLSLNFPAFLTTAAQVSHSHGNPTLALTNITGTTASASNGLTLSLSGVAAQTTQTQPAGNIAGIGTTFGGANLSASMTFNSNGLNLSMSAAAPGGGGAINVSAGTTSGNLQTLQFNNGNGVSFGLNGSTVTASVNAAGGGATKSFYENVPVIHGTQTFNAVSSTMYIYPFNLDQNMSVGFVRLPFSVSVPVTTGGAGSANATITGNMGFTHGFVLYTQGTGVNANSLQHYTSTSGTGSFGTTLAQGTQSSQMTVTVNGSFGQSGAQTNLGTGVSYGVSSGSRVINSSAMSNFTGPRFVDIPFDVSLSPGNYWLGIGRSWSSANNSTIFNGVNPLSSNIFISQSNITWGIMGSVTNTSNVMRQPGAGYFTTNASIISTASINAVGQLSVTTSNLVPYFQFIRKA